MLSGFNRPGILLGRLLSFYRVKDKIPARVFSSSASYRLVDLDLPWNEFSLIGVSSFRATDNLARLIVLSVGLYKSRILSIETLLFLEKLGDRAFYNKELLRGEVVRLGGCLLVTSGD